MDLLFKRYANPFTLLEQMILADRFGEFVSEFLNIHNSETENDTLWEMYLHHPFLDKTFDEFKNQCGIKKASNQPANIEATIDVVKNSIDVLSGFEPDDN